MSWLRHHGHPFGVARDYMDAIGFRPDDATLEDVKALLRSFLTARRCYKEKFEDTVSAAVALGGPIAPAAVPLPCAWRACCHGCGHDAAVVVVGVSALVS